MTSLDARTVLLLLHPDRRRVLLLRRSPDKKLFPNLITGIGGAVELSRGEGDDLERSVLRELSEETRIATTDVLDLRLRLSTLLTRGHQQVVLLWFTADLRQEPVDLICTEGQLAFFALSDLPLPEMVSTARAAIPFVLALPDSDRRIHTATFDDALRLVEVKGDSQHGDHARLL